MNSRNWTPDEVARAINLSESGYRCAEIAQMLGRTESSLRLKLLSLGLSSKRISTGMRENAEACSAPNEDRRPSKVNEDIRARAERELECREQRVADRKQIETAKLEILENRILQDFRSHLCNEPVTLELVPHPPRPRDQTAHTAVLVLSDIHAGQVIDSREVDGLGQYNPAVTVARLRHLELQVCRILQGRSIAKLLILFAGDILHGHLGHTLEDDLTIPIALQTDFALNILFALIVNLSVVVPDVRIYGVAGNHGRWPGMRRMPSDRRWSNLDTIVYSSLAALCEHAGLENVTFDDGISARRIIDVEKFRIELMHGDEIRGGNFCTAGMSREVTNATLRNVQAGRKAPDYYVIGDKHFSASLPFGTGAFLVNGSFVGIDVFGLNFTASPPSQTLFFLDPELGKVESHEIKLQHAELPSPLPYKFKSSLNNLIRKYAISH